MGEEVSFECSFDLNKQIVSVDGDMSAKITFFTDATQIAKVLSSAAKFHKQRILLTLRALPNNAQNEGHKEQTFR